MEAKKILVLLLTLIVGVKVTYLNAQVCGSTNLPVNQLINDAEIVVLGEVVDKQSFWNYEDNIFTKHTIKVAQSSKKNTNEIYILTEGGTVDDLTFTVLGAIDLTLNKQVIFFLNENEQINNNKTNGITYKLIDLANYNQISNAVENVHSSIAIDKFNQMMIAKHNASFKFFRSEERISKTKQVDITGLNPQKIAGGNNEVLTITGSGFGNFSGSAKVAMRSPSSISTIIYEDIKAEFILSWSDTKIEFIVPGDDITEDTDGFATGAVQITTESDEVSTSTQTVEVIYNKKVYNGVSISLRSKDNNGTTAIYVEQQLINDGALPAIKSALATWNCATGTSLVYAGAVSGVCKKYDGLNVVCYDATLSSFTLGNTRSVSRNCSNAGLADQLDADIRINSNINWSFTDDVEFSQYHFESVMLHEIGHAFTLGHVLNEADVMYPTLYNGRNKSELTNNDLAGGVDVMSNSTTENNCSVYGAIIPYNSNLACSPCANISGVTLENLTEKSVYLSWSKIPNAEKYELQYRLAGLQWNSYTSYTNNVILFDLEPCTTVECRLLALCDSETQSLNERLDTFTTFGCK